MKLVEYVLKTKIESGQTQKDINDALEMLKRKVSVLYTFGSYKMIN
ncbi:MAG: hypothetical protein K0B02_01190 [DPANN group archaeon]|nr:hypothetical protein [DPANN group archaeon]